MFTLDNVRLLRPEDKIFIMNIYNHLSPEDQRFIRYNIKQFISDNQIYIIEYDQYNSKMAMVSSIQTLMQVMVANSIPFKLVNPNVTDAELDIAFGLQSVYIGNDIHALENELMLTDSVEGLIFLKALYSVDISDKYGIVTAVEKVLDSQKITSSVAFYSGLKVLFTQYQKLMSIREHLLMNTTSLVDFETYTITLNQLLEYANICEAGEGTSKDYISMTSLEIFFYSLMLNPKDLERKELAASIYCVKDMCSKGYHKDLTDKNHMQFVHDIYAELYTQKALPTDDQLFGIYEMSKCCNEIMYQDSHYTKVNLETENTVKVPDAKTLDKLNKQLIMDAISEKANMEINENEISFDIPETILAGYMIEYAKFYPIELVEYGRDYRHVVSVDGISHVLLTIRGTTTKYYGIGVSSKIGDDTTASIVEFTTRNDGSYIYQY